MLLEHMREHVALVSDVALECCGCCGLDCKVLRVAQELWPSSQPDTAAQVGALRVATSFTRIGQPEGSELHQLPARCPYCNGLLCKYAMDSHNRQMHHLELLAA
jgi:hypothetical protein